MPPGVWNGFKGMSDPYAIVANCCTHPHDPSRSRAARPVRERHSVRLVGQTPLTGARCSLTGAAGFVGSRLARALLALGYDVHAVVRDEAGPRLRGVTGLRLGVLRPGGRGGRRRPRRRVGRKLCFHCAWIATPGAYLTSPENGVHVAAAETLGRALVEAGCSRLVALGTCFEYAPSERPLSEASPLGPTTPYAQAKVAAHELLTHVCEGTATSLAWARLFYLYGPFEDPRRLVPAVTRALLDGRAAPTTAGAQVRDFLHVDDVARALAAVAQSDLVGPVNVASGRPVTVREIVGTIGRLTGREDLLQLGAMPYAAGDPMVVAADTRRLESCGWAPELSLAEGLSRTVAWWRGQLEAR